MNEPDRLTLEVNAAIAAGMSYGQWKAQGGAVDYTPPSKPEKSISAEQRCPTHTITCAGCGSVFMGRYARFCSDCLSKRRRDGIVRSKPWERSHDRPRA